MPTGAPLVGRADELRRFTEVLQGVLVHRRPAVVLVTGQAGMGKSRFLQEAVTVARGRGVLALHGTAGPLQRDLSYAPLVEALRPLLRGTGPSGRARIEALVEGLSDLARLFDGLPLVPPPPLADLGLERTRLFEAVTRLLDRAAAERPVAVVVDDLHWADPASLGLLHYAVRGLAGRPVLFLLAFREAEADAPLRDLTAALRCGDGATEIPLRPLDGVSVDALARTTLGGAVPGGLVAVLAQRTGGVPLLVGAVITKLVEEGTLFRSGGRWVLGPDTADAVPAAVRSLLGARIERLPGPARAALDALAVCGGRAPVDGPSRRRGHAVEPGDVGGHVLGTEPVGPLVAVVGVGPSIAPGDAHVSHVTTRIRTGAPRRVTGVTGGTLASWPMTDGGGPDSVRS